jgi:hypothetical protein
MGAAGALAASDDTPAGWPLAGLPTGPQRHPVPVRTGVSWRDLPERCGPWETVYKRFARWQTDGTWARIEASLQTQADGAGELDWDAQIDSSVVRAHQHAAGARKGVGRRPHSAAASARAVTGCRPHPADRAGRRRAGGPSGWARSAADPGGLSGRGQGLQQPGQPGGAAGPPHPPHHPRTRRPEGQLGPSGWAAPGL